MAEFGCEYERYPSKDRVAACMRHYLSEASAQKPVCPEGHNLVQTTCIANFECKCGRSPIKHR